MLSRAFELVAHRRRDADLDEEIAAHLDLAAAEQRARGLSADEARAAAERSFGGVLRTKEAYRDGRGFALFDAFLQELRFAARGLRKSRTFTLVAVLTLALAIGANTAIFSIVYSALIKPLPFRDADRLVLIQTVPEHEAWPIEFPPPALHELQPRMHTVDALAFFQRNSYALASSDGAEIVQAAVVSDRFFSTLDGRLIAGRALQAEDAAAPVVVIGERLARRLFGEPGGAIGRTLSLSSHAYQVVGVAGRSFAFPTRTTEVWVPATYAASVSLRGGAGFFQAIARLRDGVDPIQAQTDIAAAVAAFVSVHPDFFRQRLATSLVPLRQSIVGSVRPLLLILWATVGLVLLIACANLANLLLARNTARWHETTVRIALGASRGRLLSRHLIESAVLSLAGTAAGVTLAEGVLVVLRRVTPQDLSWLTHVDMNQQVLAFAAALGTLTAMCVGIVPALQPTGGLLSSRVSAAASPGSRRLRRALCIIELAAAIVLLVGATLLGRSLVALLQTDIGVETEHVMTASVDLEFSHKPFNSDTREVVARVLAALRAQPGVRAVGVSTSLPPDRGRMMTLLTRKSDSAQFPAAVVAATPGYFEALGVRLVAGRFFEQADDANHPQVMIMSASTARRFFGDGEVIGRAASVPMPPHDGLNGAVDMKLVGIVSGVKYAGLAMSPAPQIYRPLAQQPWPSLSLVVRTDRDLAGLPSTLRRTIASVDPTLVVSAIQTLDERVETDAAPSRFRTALLVSFAGLALLIAAIGLYGVIAYSVAQRTMEIGIRMALGARTEDVMRMVLREGAVLGLTGVAIGLAAAYGVTRLLASLLYGITATDPISFALAAAILIVVALLASYLPARRAAHVDPLVALRTE